MMKQTDSDATDALRPEQVERAFALLRAALPGRADAELISTTPPIVRVRYGPNASTLHLHLPGDASSGEDSLVVLPQASKREVEAMRARDANFVDLRGSVLLNLPFMAVDRQDLLPEVSREPHGFPPATESVVFVLLAEHPAPSLWTVRRLARAAEVSAATASRAVRHLERLGLVMDDSPGPRTPARIRIPEPERLLRAWAERSVWSRHPRIDLLAPVELGERWIRAMGNRLGVRWALTLHAGAALWAPHALEEDVHLYVDVPSGDALSELALHLDAASSAEGRLHLMAPRSPAGVWDRTEGRQGLPVVHPLRLVVDLWHYPVRGREQAEHLLETVVRPRWGGAG